MIQTRKDLIFYIYADRIMNGRPARRTLKEVIKDKISHEGKIIGYLRAMRKYAYYTNTTKKGLPFKAFLRLFWGRRYRKLGMLLGFSIGHNSLGYGVKIPHYGTIVVNGEAEIGNFAVLHTCTCIAGKKKIGDYLYLSVGSQITGEISLGDGVTVAAHSLVNKSFEENVLLAGAPAGIKRVDYPNWPDRDGDRFVEQVCSIEKLRSVLFKR